MNEHSILVFVNNLQCCCKLLQFLQISGFFHGFFLRTFLRKFFTCFLRKFLRVLQGFFAKTGIFCKSRDIHGPKNACGARVIDTHKYVDGKTPKTRVLKHYEHPRW